MLLNQSRGEDATGLVYLHKKKKTYISYKATDNVTDLLEKGTIPERAFHSTELLGHTRNSSNAFTASKDSCVHPFLFKNWLVAHNGFISNWRDCLKDLDLSVKEDLDVEIDSHIILRMIHKHGWKGLEELKGWGACWFVDHDDKIFLWNSGGVLSYYVGADFLMFSSLEKHIKITLDANVKCITIPSDGTLMRLDPEKLTLTTVGTYAMQKEKKAELNSATGKVTYNYGSGMGAYQGQFGYGAWNDDDVVHTTPTSDHPVIHKSVDAYYAAISAKRIREMAGKKEAGNSTPRPLVAGGSADKPDDYPTSAATIDFSKLSSGTALSNVLLAIQFAPLWYCHKCKMICTSFAIDEDTNGPWHKQCSDSAYPLAVDDVTRLIRQRMPKLDNLDYAQLGRRFKIYDMIHAIVHIEKKYKEIEKTLLAFPGQE